MSLRVGPPGGAAISAGTQSQNTGTVIFSNSNGVSFGISNGVLTATVTPGAAAGIAAFQLPNTTYTSGTVNFQNSNGISFGSTNAGGVTASYTVPGATVFSNSNNVTFGLAGSTVTASAGGGSPNFSAGTTSSALGSVVFSNSNGVSFGLNGSTITGSVAAQTNQSLGIYGSSQTTGQSSSSTYDARSLSIVGAGNVSVGWTAGSLVISGAAGGQTNQTEGVFVAGNTTGQSSSSTYDARTLNISAAGLVSVGWSSNSLIISAPATANLTQFSAGFSTQGNTAGNTGIVTGQVQFVGTNGITLSGSTNAGSMTISISAGGGGSPNFSAGTTSSALGSVVFSNSNGVSFGLNGSTITASVATSLTNVNVSAGTTSNNLSAVVFSNSNGVSFGLNGSTVTGSVAAQTNQTVGMFAVGNSTQNSSTTFDARTLSFDGLGAMSVGFSNGSIQLSAPVTSSLVGTAGISVSVNGSTLSISNINVTRSIVPAGNMTAISAFGQGSASIQYVPIDNPVSGTRIDALFSWAGASSATTATGAVVISAYAAIYTRNVSTLSSLSSGSTQTTYTYASNSAGNTQLISGAIRPVSVPINFVMTQGEYFVAFNMSTNSSSVGLSTTNLAQTVSVMGGNQLQTALNYAEFANQTATSTGLYGGMGIYSAQTNGLPAAISLSAIAQTGASLSQANIALVFRNA